MARTVGRTFHVVLAKGTGLAAGTEYLVPDPFPTRGDARKFARKAVRNTSWETFRIDTQRVYTKRRNGSQHLSVAAPSLLQSPRYTVIYRNPDLIQEVVVTSTDEPAKERRFKVVGHGKPVFKAVSITELNQPPTRKRRLPTKEDTVAKTKTRSKSKSKKAVEPEVDETTIDPSDIEDLDDLDAIESEEPDEVDTDDEDSDDELAGLNKKELKARAKEAGIKGYTKLGVDDLRAAILAASEEDEEDDDEEDEDDGLDDLDRTELKALMKDNELGKAKKSQSDDDLRQLLRDNDVSAEDEEEDDEEEDSPPAKAKGKSKGKGKGKQAPPARELPAGKVGVEQVAKLARTDGRAVRVFLRGVEGAEAKFKKEGRWAFTEKQAKQIAAKVKARSKSS